jgi:hypothetical protein
MGRIHANDISNADDSNHWTHCQPNAEGTHFERALAIAAGPVAAKTG